MVGVPDLVSSLRTTRRFVVDFIHTVSIHESYITWSLITVFNYRPVTSIFLHARIVELGYQICIDKDEYIQGIRLIMLIRE